MLSDSEKKVMSGYLMWQYPDMPSGFNVVDFYLSNPSVKATVPRALAAPERIMNFMLFESFPHFTMNIHISQNEDIEYLRECIACIKRPDFQKRINIFIHIHGNLDPDNIASLNEAAVITLESWQRNYRQKLSLSPGKVLVSLPVIPENAGDMYDIINDVYREGIRTFITRFDPRPRWEERELRILEKNYDRLAKLFLNTVEKKDPIIWDELELAVRHQMRCVTFDCGRGDKRISLSGEGHVYPCRFMLERESTRDIMGDISQGSYYKIRGLRNAQTRFIRHPLYCRWECRFLHSGGYGEMLGRYSMLIDRVSEKVTKQLDKMSCTRDVSALPDSFAAFTRLYIHIPSEGKAPELRSPEAEPDEAEPLSGNSCFEQKAESLDTDYEEIYLDNMRWLSRDISHIRRHGKGRYIR